MTHRGHRTNKWDCLRVTDDPDIEARLRELADELDSDELAGYAHSIGLYPPGYGPDMNPPIALAWPPDTPDGGTGILVWDIRNDDEGDQSEDGS